MDIVRKDFRPFGKLIIILTSILLLLSTVEGTVSSPGKTRDSSFSSLVKIAKSGSEQDNSNPFTLWFDVINSPPADDKLYDDDYVQPDEVPVNLWFDSIESTPEENITEKPDITPTRVVNLPGPSTPQSIRPSIVTVAPTVTVTVTSIVLVPTTIRPPPVTSTVFITVLPQEVEGSMDAFFREMAAMTAVMRAKMATLHKENKELMEKVVRLSRPSLIIDNLRKMPPHKRKLLIARMEKLMNTVSRMNDKRFRQEPIILQVTLEQLVHHLEDLNPLVYKK